MTTFEKMAGLSRRRMALLESMVAPARAAANQMSDAGMKAGAEPLLQKLFEYDAIGQEMTEALKSDPQGFLRSWLEAMERGELDR